MVKLDIDFPPELREALNAHGYFSANDVIRQICLKLVQVVQPDLLEKAEQGPMSELDHEVITHIASCMQPSEILQSFGKHIKDFGAIDQAIDYMKSRVAQATSQDYRDTCSKCLDLMLGSQRRH